jgi:hypothetical protein
VFREHYKQLVPHWCAEFDADNFDRVTAGAGLVASQSTKRNAKYDEPFTKKRWNAQSPTCHKAGDAADLKSELIKAGGSALVKPF